ncbi:uncharacterized protein LOC135810356 [Sycon ciliatum]|uniref:uncharacterized protein LOC135810356 n=1 Tax=Sycon ciliatum TaxID=27933 RepID=UPI0031F6D464
MERPSKEPCNAEDCCFAPSLLARSVVVRSQPRRTPTTGSASAGQTSAGGSSGFLLCSRPCLVLASANLLENPGVPTGKLDWRFGNGVSTANVREAYAPHTSFEVRTQPAALDDQQHTSYSSRTRDTPGTGDEVWHTAWPLWRIRVDRHREALRTVLTALAAGKSSDSNGDSDKERVQAEEAISSASDFLVLRVSPRMAQPSVRTGAANVNFRVPSVAECSVGTLRKGMPVCLVSTPFADVCPRVFSPSLTRGVVSNVLRTRTWTDTSPRPVSGAVTSAPPSVQSTAAYSSDNDGGTCTDETRRRGTTCALPVHGQPRQQHCGARVEQCHLYRCQLSSCVAASTGSVLRTCLLHEKAAFLQASTSSRENAALHLCDRLACKPTPVDSTPLFKSHRSDGLPHAVDRHFHGHPFRIGTAQQSQPQASHTSSNNSSSTSCSSSTAGGNGGGCNACPVDDVSMVLTDAPCVLGSEGGMLLTCQARPRLAGFLSLCLTGQPGNWLGLSTVCPAAPLLQAVRALQRGGGDTPRPEATPLAGAPSSRLESYSSQAVHADERCVPQRLPSAVSSSSSSSSDTTGGTYSCRCRVTGESDDGDYFDSSIVSVHCGSVWSSGVVISRRQRLLLTCRHAVQASLEQPAMHVTVARATPIKPHRQPNHQQVQWQYDVQQQQQQQQQYHHHQQQQHQICQHDDHRHRQQHHPHQSSHDHPRGNSISSAVASILASTGSDSGVDLAILQLNQSDYERLHLDELPMQKSSGVSPGHPVLAVGYPLLAPDSIPSPTVTSGIVSCVHATRHCVSAAVADVHSDVAWYQTSAGVNRGASGGALVSSRTGELLAILSSNMRNGEGADYPHLNFSQPVHALTVALENFDQTGDIAILRGALQRLEANYPPGGPDALLSRSKL